MRYIGKNEEMLKNVIRNIVYKLVTNEKSNIIIYTINKHNEEYIKSRLIYYLRETTICIGNIFIPINRLFKVELVKYNDGFVIEFGKSNEQNINIISYQCALRGRNPIDYMYIDINETDQIDWKYINSIMKDQHNIFIYEE